MPTTCPQCFTMNKIFHRIVISGLLITTGCVYNKVEPEKQNCNSQIPAIVSFKNDIQPIFTQNCALGSCHSNSRKLANFNLEEGFAYAQLMEPGSGYIDTIQPNFSLLYASMISVSNPMPPNGKLNDCEIEIVLRWKEQKAKNN